MRRVWIGWLVILLGACAPLWTRTATLTPTATALSTQVAPAVTTPAPSVTPSASPSIAPVSPTATVLSTATLPPWPTSSLQVTPIPGLPWPTFTPTSPSTPWGDVPYAPVQILRPGIEAAVVSPVEVLLQIHRSMTPGIVHLELWAQWEDEPRLLYRRLLRLYPPKDPAVKNFFITDEIPFEIRPAYTWGRLQAVVRDAKGLPLFQQAVPLRLLRFGVEAPSARQQLRLPIVVTAPRENAVFPLEGTLRLEGMALSTTGVMEILLYDRDSGRILMATSAFLSSPDPQGYGTFAVDWPYRFTGRLNARLVFRLYDPRVDGVAYLESVDVVFRP